MFVFSLTLAACSATPDPIVIDLELGEFSFSQTEIQLMVGQEVTINLTNVGNLDHEFMIGQSMMEMEGHPAHYMTELFDTAGVEPMVMMKEMEGMEHDMDHGDMDLGFMVSVPLSDATTTLTFTVTEDMVGTWEYGCFLQEGVHYEQGMIGTLTITQ